MRKIYLYYFILNTISIIIMGVFLWVTGGDMSVFLLASIVGYGIIFGIITGVGLYLKVKGEL